MLVPSAYFRDETIWRGRVIALTHGLKTTLYEIGFWIGAMYLAFPLTKWWTAPLVVGGVFCLRMAFGYFDGLQSAKHVEKDVDRYFDETYSD